MDTNVATVDANATISEVIETMTQRDVLSVLVQEKGLPIGVVTDRDLLRRCIGKGMDVNSVRAKEIMSSPLILIDADAPIGEAMGKMVEKDVRRLFIVKEGKVVGRITDKEVIENAMGILLTLSSTNL